MKGTLGAKSDSGKKLLKELKKKNPAIKLGPDFMDRAAVLPSLPTLGGRDSDMTFVSSAERTDVHIRYPQSDIFHFQVSFQQKSVSFFHSQTFYIRREGFSYHPLKEAGKIGFTEVKETGGIWQG